MKRIVRIIVIETGALYLVSRITEGLYFENGIQGLLLTGLALAVSALLIKPVINVLLLPLNLVTFGLFKWVGHAISLYLIDLLLPAFEIVDFHFLGISTQYFSIPPISLPGVAAYVAFSFLLSFITTFIFWLVG